MVSRNNREVLDVDLVNATSENNFSSSKDKGNDNDIPSYLQTN